MILQSRLTLMNKPFSFALLSFGISFSVFIHSFIFFRLSQMMIKRALSESGCPPHILEVLMEKCHERRWPPGLNSLETRQNNRRTYDNYVCRRIPGMNHAHSLCAIFFNKSMTDRIDEIIYSILLVF